MNARAVLTSIAVFLLLAVSRDVIAQKRDFKTGSGTRQVLSLDYKNNGQEITARVGQQIEISLGTVGPRQYGTPEISSPAVQLVSTALDWPANPGGPRFVYIFEAGAQGEAQVTVPIINGDLAPGTSDLTFTATIRVVPAGGRPPARRVLLTPDQANTTPWRNAWTNLNNFARQTFIPSLPRLTGVEVQLELANPGRDRAEVSMMILDEKGVGLAQISKTVTAGDCGHVLFVLPKGGLRVMPGRVYSITLSGGDNLFGWKYVVGGYAKGAAFFNDKPLLPGAHSTFLFRTFGRS